MLRCEGYKMFRGTALIRPVNMEAYPERGEWLYKPEYDCWYVNGKSYPNEIVDIAIDEDVELEAKYESLRNQRRD